MMQECRQIMAELFARTFPERSTCRWANIGTDLLTLSLGTVYLGHINGGGVHAVDQLTEHHTVSERQLIFLAAKI